MKLNSILVLSAIVSSTLGLTFLPQQELAMAQRCRLPERSFRLIPVRPDGPFIRTDGKVYMGDYAGGQITLCNGRPIRPLAGCEEAYQWNNGNVRYQVHLICNSQDYEARVMVFRGGKKVLDEGLYSIVRAD